MGSPELSDQVRKRLIALTAEDRPDAERLLQRLRELREVEGVSSCSAVMHLLAHLNLREDEAEELLVELLQHRDEVGRLLGRDPGLRVAAIDYLSNVKSLLSNPTIVEVSQLERTERSAITDDLTGLYNRRYFQSAFEVEVRRARRYVLPLSLVMLDLDSFKSVNDLYGHPFGDLVLQLVGQVLRQAVRESDLACRLGGEELAVILPETDRLGAFAVGERIRREIETHFAEKAIDGRAVAMTISGGIASYPDDGENQETLVGRADQALYHAKAHGRNQISLYHSERRGAPRHRGRPRARVRLMLRGGDSPLDATVINLSTAGVLVETEGTAVAQDSVEVMLDTRSATGKVESCVLRGRVLRSEPIPATGQQRVAIAFFERMSDERLMHHAVGLQPLRSLRGGRR